MYINSVDAIQAVSQSAVEHNTYQSIIEVINHIKAFFGDIYGPFIYYWRVLGEVRNVPIKFRIDTMALPIFLNILSMKFIISDELATTQGDCPLCFSFTLKSKCNVSHEPIMLQAMLAGRKSFKFIVASLDIDLLTEDDSALYVRGVNVPNMRYVIDKITLLKERICARRFCAIQRFSHNRLSNGLGGGKEMSSVIEDSIRLINDGWTMDDHFIGEDAWVISKWGNLLDRPKSIRTRLSDMKIQKMINNDECALCQEKIKRDDLVITTSCHHTFHWECPLSDKGCTGLKTWVQEHNRQACPCCRSMMF